jgi:hypothetical protein
MRRQTEQKNVYNSARNVYRWIPAVDQTTDTEKLQAPYYIRLTEAAERCSMHNGDDS